MEGQLAVPSQWNPGIEDNMKRSPSVEQCHQSDNTFVGSCEIQVIKDIAFTGELCDKFQFEIELVAAKWREIKEAWILVKLVHLDSLDLDLVA